MADRRGNSVERYYASKRKKRKKRKVRLYLTLSLVSILIFVILSLTVFFNIRDFRIQGNQIYTAEQIIGVMDLKKGDNLFRLNKFNIADRLVEELPYIGSVEIYRDLPTTLCVDVQETVARFVVYTGGKYALLDQNLKVLEIREELPADLGFLIGAEVGDATPGKKAVFASENSEKLLTQLIDALYDRFDPTMISAIDVSEPFDIRAYYDHHRIKILLGDTDALGDKLQMAQTAISQNGINEKARINVTDSKAAYYLALEEGQEDDLEGMLHGTAEAKEDILYMTPEETPEDTEEGTEAEETEQDVSEETEE